LTVQQHVFVCPQITHCVHETAQIKLAVLLLLNALCSLLKGQLFTAGGGCQASVTSLKWKQAACQQLRPRGYGQVHVHVHVQMVSHLGCCHCCCLLHRLEMLE
jgi:hypothetical protein